MALAVAALAVGGIFQGEAAIENAQRGIVQAPGQLLGCDELCKWHRTPPGKHR